MATAAIGSDERLLRRRIAKLAQDKAALEATLEGLEASYQAQVRDLRDTIRDLRDTVQTLRGRIEDMRDKIAIPIRALRWMRELHDCLGPSGVGASNENIVTVVRDRAQFFENDVPRDPAQ